MNLFDGKHPAYERMYETELPDIKSQGMVLRHKKTGARICLVSNDDANKVFSIGFRTPPSDSTGVPHIIEHTVLCGSDKYPLKDPFIELEKGSLQTFLNAMTYPDKTLYPLASCNDADFQNLMDVYMDAVCHPNIYKYEEIFKQEGWHYELESPEAPITINGVVYSEMKGAYSSADEYLYQKISAALFPDTVYSKDSGGDPDVIPSLTYEAYLNFHRTYYHPSNSYIYLYGDMDMEEKLAWLDEAYLSKYDYLEMDTTIPMQKPRGMQYAEEVYSIGEADDCAHKTYLSCSMTIGDTKDVKRSAAWGILESVLFSAPGAPVKQALIEAGIGSDIMSSFDTDYQQPVFSIVAKESEPEKREAFLNIIKDELTRLTKEGLRSKSLLAAIGNSEFRYREADFGQYPKGLLYGLKMMSSWLYDDAAAFSYFNMNAIYEELRAEVGTGYFEQLIREDMLENEHTVCLTMRPQKGLAAEREEALAKKLSAYKASLSEKEIEKIAADTLALRAYQEKEESEEVKQCLPLLSISDIKKEVEPVYNEEHTVAGVKVVHHDIFTNGIAYADYYFDVTDLPEEELPYLGLLINTLGYIDTEKRTYLEFTDECSLHTGGISVLSDTSSSMEYPKQFSGYLLISSRMLYPEMENAGSLIAEMLCESKLYDTKRLKEILAEACTKVRSILENGGHSTAISQAFSYMSAQDYFLQQVKKLGYYEAIRQMLAHFEEEQEQIVSHLQKILAHSICKERMIVSVTCDKEGYEQFVPAMEQLVDAIAKIPAAEAFPKMEKAPWDGGYPLEKKNEGITYGGQVQYVARCGNFRDAGLTFNGALSVAKTILSLEYLWNNVRVQGGAYGCMCGFAPISGNSYFVSYRDPKLKETEQVYEMAGEFLRNITLDDRELTKYIIGTISGIDTPKTPRMKGLSAMNLYMTGYPEEERQKRRDEVLSATQESIRACAAYVDAFIGQEYRSALLSESMKQEAEELYLTVRPLL